MIVPSGILGSINFAREMKVIRSASLADILFLGDFSFVHLNLELYSCLNH